MRGAGYKKKIREWMRELRSDAVSEVGQSRVLDPVIEGTPGKTGWNRLQFLRQARSGDPHTHTRIPAAGEKECAQRLKYTSLCRQRSYVFGENTRVICYARTMDSIIRRFLPGTAPNSSSTFPYIYLSPAVLFFAGWKSGGEGNAAETIANIVGFLLLLGETPECLPQWCGNDSDSEGKLVQFLIGAEKSRGGGERRV